MAAKRFIDDSDQDPDRPNDKRIRPNTSGSSLASVIQEVVKMKNMQNLLPFLEPMLKRVVSEEVERVMSRCFPPPSLRIQAPEQQPSSLQLSFNKRLSLPIFTGSRILDTDGNPITVVLFHKNINNGGQGGVVVPTSLPHPIKLEIVVLDGDFTPADNEDWTSEQFEKHVVKERAGKRPLLAGEMNLVMRDGIAPTGDIEFTDNSSWIRSRKFRVAVRVNHNYQGVRIREAITEAFMVKDHRGELYKKHHPPMLHDDVWRLEKIGKDGAFHKKLSSEGIKTVQDFLKLAVNDSHRLRKILGIGMSEKMWEVTIRHAMTCDMGSKFYIYRGPQFTLVLNPICKLIRADINGQIFSTTELSPMNKSYIDKLVREAYLRWSSLEEIDGVLNDNIALLTQGDQSHQTVEQFPSNDPAPVVTYNQNYYYGDKSTEVASYVPSNSAQMGCNQWPQNPPYTTALFPNDFPYDDGEITPSGLGSADVDRATRQY